MIVDTILVWPVVLALLWYTHREMPHAGRIGPFRRFILRRSGVDRDGRQYSGTIGQLERKPGRPRLREEGFVFSEKGRDARQPFER